MLTMKFPTLFLPLNHMSIPLIDLIVKANIPIYLMQPVAFTTITDFVDIPIFGHHIVPKK
jgi:hypothetical protein